MVEKFQSVNGITKQLDDGYEYYFALYNGEIAGYFGVQPQEGSLFLSKLYLKRITEVRAYLRICLNI